MGASRSQQPSVIPWIPQPGPQHLAIYRHDIDELFYGGAVGGGKSDYLLGDFAQDVPNYGSAWQGILFRKTLPELKQLIQRSQEIYPPWFPGISWKETDKEWHWPNGAILRFAYMEHASDWMRYWGHAYTWIGWDELPTWPNLDAYMRMKVRLRSASKIPNKRIRATGNPGGPGHAHVKAYWKIDSHPLGGVEFSVGGMRRLFVRSRLADNKILLGADPNYGERLNGLGNANLVRAWLEGDWNVIAGAFFPEFSTDVHVVRPMDLPSHWLRFRAADWGSAKPFAIGWFAVSDGTLPEFPRGALIQYREWYGMKPEQINVGLKLTAEEVAEGIRSREQGDILSHGMSVLDPAAFANDGGPSIAERMAREPYKVIFRRADNKRVSQQGALGGWDQLRQRLKGDDRPMIYFFSTCEHSIRTLPALQHDPDRAEDVDTDAEDHAGDMVRYACMARPWIKDVPKSSPARYDQHMSVNEIIRRQRDKRLENE